MTENYSNPIIRKGGPVTLIGDAAPYESIQRTGANQALLDALARAITKNADPYQNGETGVRKVY
jgi:hypothetical protein